MKQWFLIESEKEYKESARRYEEIREAGKGSPEHKEKLLLSFLLNKYDQERWSVPELDPIELIKERMEDLGLKSADLAREYGDKGTISKVLNYKQPLSLNMIRLFSQMLRIPAEALMKEYKLDS